jgi:hypothetical protein
MIDIEALIRQLFRRLSWRTTPAAGLKKAAQQEPENQSLGHGSSFGTLV